MRSEQEARAEILDLVAEYYKQFKTSNTVNQGYITYASRVFDQHEMINLVDSALDFWLTSGKYTAQFEKKFCQILGTKHCSLVNSGSSANLLAFMALTSPLLGKRAIRRGDEVITVAAGFPTTVTPIVQYGAIPVFVDITIPQYNINVEEIESALTDKTKAIMIAHTLGNPFDLESVKKICLKYNLWLIEDNCDSLGSLYKIDNEYKYTGTIGDIGTSSFYPPHHITMGEGGAVYTNNDLLNKIIKSMRDWGRDCVCPSGKDNVCGNRFNGKHGDLPTGYDHKYVYSHFGYNLKATDMQASIGVAQLDKLHDFIQKRRENFDYLTEILSRLQEFIILPEGANNSKPSWFGFMITCRKEHDRDYLVKFLEKNGVQTRMLFAGNLVKHPCFTEMRMAQEGYRIHKQLINTDRIMSNSFWIGVYPGMNKDMLDKMASLVTGYFLDSNEAD